MYLNTGILMALADMKVPIWPLTLMINVSENQDNAITWFIEWGNSLVPFIGNFILIMHLLNFYIN